MVIDEKYMYRCIALAQNGLGTTYPNPLVGSVIVYHDRIIGEGWHRKAGEPHAEVHAIQSVTHKDQLKDATLYVSLEPCSHFGKTPPCADLIIEHKIPRVVIGTIDPFAKVCGNGIQKLKEAGIEVYVGILEAECQALNKRFFTFHQKQRPYIILKWAESADGFIAPKTKEVQKPIWISNRYSRQLVHKWRTEEQGILVGTKTVLDDNPKLDVRTWTGNNPVRIVLDKNNEIPKESLIFDSSAPTIILNEHLENGSKTPAKQIADQLFNHGIQSIIIEGGRRTLQAFIDANIWDEARVFKGSNLFLSGTKAPVITGKIVAEKKIVHDQLVIYSNYD